MIHGPLNVKILEFSLDVKTEIVEFLNFKNWKATVHTIWYICNVSSLVFYFAIRTSISRSIFVSCCLELHVCSLLLICIIAPYSHSQFYTKFRSPLLFKYWTTNNHKDQTLIKKKNVNKVYFDILSKVDTIPKSFLFF